MRAKLVPAGQDWNNYHTHTFRCHHATGDVEDYAQRAAELGMTKLGMSDHAHFNIENDGDHPLHMSRLETPDYVRACREANGIYNGLRVFCGVECDYDASYAQALREYYLEELEMDYLIGSIHEFWLDGELIDCFSRRHFGAKELHRYTDLYIRLIESGIFTFCAHPDLFGSPIEIGENPPGWDENAVSASREILEAASANNAVLEINVSGVWKTNQKNHPQIIYPRWQFWEIASDYDIRVIVNTDAHSVDRLNAYVEYGMNLVSKYGLKRVELD